jgi:hypothetical protein
MNSVLFVRWLPPGVDFLDKIKSLNMAVATNVLVTGGATPASDSIIVIENGSLNLSYGSSVDALRTTIVLTGNNTVPSAINFQPETDTAQRSTCRVQRAWTIPGKVSPFTRTQT